MRIGFLSLAVGVALVLSGCATAPVTTFDDDWFVTFGSDAQGEWIEGEEGAVRVTIDDGHISGQICNSWGGDISINGSRLTIESLMSTEMYCTEPEGIMDRETRFLADLALVTTIELIDGRLRLSGNGVEFEFARGY
jgi:heat shock protein HslJ